MNEFSQGKRPEPRPLFVQAEKLLKVYFYTSNTDKYLQARLVFDRRGLLLDYFKSKTEPYDEDYVGDTADLLRKAISQVTDQIGAGHLIFVEDTSLRLEALSDPSHDFPGMEVKHWFQSTSFEECDAALKAAGGNRGAVVKSDIALKIPGLAQPLILHGETRGEVAKSAPEFSADPQHPWLTPETFNGWFIADGCRVPLGALPIEEALHYDFRVRALEALLDRLEEYAAVLNLPTSAYRRKREVPAPAASDVSLFGEKYVDTPALLVVGRTCAGKTTLGEYVSGRYGLRHIEASAIVRSLSMHRAPADDNDGGYAFAKRALDELGHDVVAREVIARYGDQLDAPFVVSGLRDVEELRHMLAVVPRSRVILVEASERTRFERDVRRARQSKPVTLESFRLRDSRQDSFGLLPVVEDLAHVRILNEGRLEEYHRQIDALLANNDNVPGVDLAAHPRHGPGHHQLYRCLKVLRESGGPLQCDEIEMLSADLEGVKIRHNNANKVLKGVPAFANRLDPDEDAGPEAPARVRYAITKAGLTYIELLEGRGPAFRTAGDHAD